MHFSQNFAKNSDLKNTSFCDIIFLQGVFRNPRICVMYIAFYQDSMSRLKKEEPRESRRNESKKNEISCLEDERQALK